MNTIWQSKSGKSVMYRLPLWKESLQVMSLSLGHPGAKGNDVVDFRESNNRDPILWDIAAGRSPVLLRHKHADHIRDDAPAGRRQPGEICRDQEAGSGLSCKVLAEGAETQEAKAASKKQSPCTVKAIVTVPLLTGY